MQRQGGTLHHHLGKETILRGGGGGRDAILVTGKQGHVHDGEQGHVHDTQGRSNEGETLEGKGLPRCDAR